MDVDGSYLYKKKKKLEDSGQMVSFLGLPSAPLTGWETVTEANANSLAKKIPRVTNGIVYAYLSTHAGQGSGNGTFSALTRGYIHWASGHITLQGLPSKVVRNPEVLVNSILDMDPTNTGEI